jgi:hypothetical protein
MGPLCAPSAARGRARPRARAAVRPPLGPRAPYTIDRAPARPRGGFSRCRVRSERRELGVPFSACAMRGVRALVHRLELGDRDAGVELGGRELGVAGRSSLSYCRFLILPLPSALTYIEDLAYCRQGHARGHV